MTGPLSGFAAFFWRVLRAPGTPALLLLWLGVGAAVGAAAGPGEHPAESLLLHVPAVLLPFALWARLDDPSGGLFAMGLLTALGGTLMAGGGFGRLELSPGAVAEAYERPGATRPHPVHLGAPLRLLPDDGTHVALSLGVGAVAMGEARLSLVDGREQRLGPWSVRYRRSLPKPGPAIATIRALAPDAPPRVLALRSGQTARLADDASVAVNELAADFGQGMGPAAELAIQEAGETRTDWIYVDSPDLDARLGRGRWRFELLAVDSAPALEFEVRRAGQPWVVLAGWALMVLALALRAARRGGATA